MTMSERTFLAEELRRVEVALQRVYATMNGSAESRTRLAKAKKEYRRAEAAALNMLGAVEALKLVEAQDSLCAHTPGQEALGEWVASGARELPLMRGVRHCGGARLSNMRETSGETRRLRQEDGPGPHGMP
ncbi:MULTISPECIES: hypothetical protein [Corallococcus]|uniref:hypothetical protein n=1 Tax=Corallococcus TaxID=83461 RepID=UPI0011C46146|nr:MULTISPECIES: hypothetical protein [Corallococcus]